MPSPLPPIPRTLPSLPPRKVSAILAAGTLAAGIALGALIGPVPASSLASGARAAAVARVLGLLALGESTGAGDRLLLAGSAGHAATGARRAATGARRAATNATHARSSGGAASAAGKAAGAGKATGAGASRGAGAGQSETSSSTPSSEGAPASSAPSPTKHKSPAAGGGEAGESKPARLAPVAHVWLIVLPYGQSFASVAGQAAAAPYTNTQLVHQGTLLSGYSALQASELAGDAALLSGQVAGGLSTIAPPCTGAAGAAGAPNPGAAGASAGAPNPGAAGASAGAPSASAPTTATAPCAAAEPAGAQAADAFLAEVVPRIEASAAYREGGLIAITFAAAEASAAPAIAYPAGTQVSTSSTAGAPGALLLSPFLARPGARVASAFDELAPRKSLEELLRDPSKTTHR